MSVGNGQTLAAVLLAAGQGRRFGGDKCLANLPDGTPMCVHSARKLVALLGRVSCVVRPEDTALIRLLSAEQGIELVFAHEAAQGMSASLRAGLEANLMAAGWLIALADMPLIQLSTLRQLQTAFIQHNNIIIPTHQQQAGHPVIFPQRFKAPLLALTGDRGGKAVLRNHPAACCYVEVDDPGILQDFDTAEALKHWQWPNI